MKTQPTGGALRERAGTTDALPSTMPRAQTKRRTNAAKARGRHNEEVTNGQKQVSMFEITRLMNEHVSP